MELVQTLLASEIRVYDPNVSVSALLGANKAYAERWMPQLSDVLCSSLNQLMSEAEVIVVTKREKEFYRVPQELRTGQVLVDLVRLVEDPSSVRNGRYHGIAW